MPGISFKIRNNLLERFFPVFILKKIISHYYNIAKNKIIYKINKIKI